MQQKVQSLSSTVCLLSSEKREREREHGVVLGPAKKFSFISAGDFQTQNVTYPGL